MVNSKVSSIDGTFGNWDEFSEPPTEQQIQDSVAKITDEIIAYAKERNLDMNDYYLVAVIHDPQLTYGYTVGVKAVRRVAAK